MAWLPGRDGAGVGRPAGPVLAERRPPADVPAAARRLRAFGVALVWGLSALPVLLGRASCPMAEIFGVPCPGCGMTRAARLLAKGDVYGSLRMHALALPSALGTLLFMFATVWATARLGSPVDAWGTRLGRASILAFLAIEVAVVGLWIARFAGFLGGPVPV
jgi:hypothetical protein